MPLKLHFTTAYDLFKYHNQAKSITKEKFHDRKDYPRFEYWGQKLQKEDALDFCLFNFAHNTPDWFYQEFDSAKDKYLETKGYFSAITKNLKEEKSLIDKVMSEKNIRFSDLISLTKSKNKPPLLQLVLHNRLSKEFVCLLDNGFIDSWAEEYHNDPLISKELRDLTKYKPFVILKVRGKIDRQETPHAQI